jgi:hypothetical protein
MLIKGVPEHLRSDNGPEFVARDLRKWLANIGAKTLYIQPGSPWENGFCESFNLKLRDEFLNGKMFYSLKEIRVLAECWRVHYNTVRPHSSRGCRPPAPQAWAASSLGRPQAHDTPKSVRPAVASYTQHNVVQHLQYGMHPERHLYSGSQRLGITSLRTLLSPPDYLRDLTQYVSGLAMPPA